MCGRYDDNHASNTFGDWIECGKLIQIRSLNDHPRYPTLVFKCENCGKEVKV